MHCLRALPSASDAALEAQSPGPGSWLYESLCSSYSSLSAPALNSAPAAFPGAVGAQGHEPWAWGDGASGPSQGPVSGIQLENLLKTGNHSGRKAGPAREVGGGSG